MREKWEWRGWEGGGGGRRIRAFTVIYHNAPYNMKISFLCRVVAQFPIPPETGANCEN